ncbi:LAETG motif-containing sortase-dependent surface protein [Streptomyces sp. NPDC052040]|uniref:LAETG motif-containing sortase-dependent surface protein n=1 Tax=unclassified Streptomyces TaxID=2593676 RepID=UPI0037CE4AA9
MRSAADGAADTVSTSATEPSDAASGPSDALEADGAAVGTRLADTGSVDTTPYVVGGALSLCLGGGFLAYSVRRERLEAC